MKKLKPAKNTFHVEVAEFQNGTDTSATPHADAPRPTPARN